MNTYTTEQLSPVSIGELRRLLRVTYPQLRGIVSAVACKADCIAILVGTTSPDTLLARYGAQPTASTPTIQPIAQPVQPAPTMPTALASPVSQIVATFQTPQATAPVVPVETVQPIEQTGGAVKIEGKQYLKRVLNTPMEESMVPARDPSYDLGAWRSRAVYGSMRVSTDVHVLIQSILAGNNVLLYGPPASGKTSVVMQAMGALNWPTIRFNCSRDTTSTEFMGCYTASNGSTQWIDGPLAMACRIGAVLILDEVDHLPAECTSPCHAVMEKTGALTLALHGGEVVRKHPRFRIVGTSNTSGYGDESGIHGAAQAHDAAFLSRWDCAFKVDWIEAAAERKLLTRHVAKDIAKSIVDMAGDCRTAFAKGELLYPLSLRHTINWAIMTEQTGSLATGFALAVLNKSPACDVGALVEVAQRYFGASIDGVTGGAPLATTQEESDTSGMDTAAQ
jgi:cobaltochelatase CobS